MTADQVSKLTAYNIWVNILDESVWMVLSWSFTAGDRWGKFDLTCTYLKLILFFYDHLSFFYVHIFLYICILLYDIKVRHDLTKYLLVTVLIDLTTDKATGIGCGNTKTKQADNVQLLTLDNPWKT
jgi:hypothetical protein